MRKDIENWCRSCTICLERRPTSLPLIPIVDCAFECVGVDVLQMPPSARGYKYVVVDHLMKWAEVYPLREQMALAIAKAFVEKFIPNHGVPTKLLSDQGSNFLLKLMEEVYRLTNVKKISTTAYHPQTDETVE